MPNQLRKPPGPGLPASPKPPPSPRSSEPNDPDMKLDNVLRYPHQAGQRLEGRLNKLHKGALSSSTQLQQPPADPRKPIEPDRSSSLPARPSITTSYVDPQKDLPLPPPPMFGLDGMSPSSPMARSRPTTPGGLTPTANVPSISAPLTPTTPIDGHDKPQKRRSWLPSIGRKSTSDMDRGPSAWVIGHQGKVPYDEMLLANAKPVPELWDANGDTFIYLFPRTSGKGPSFRVDSSTYAASRTLTKLAWGDIYSKNTAQSAPGRSSTDSAGQRTFSLGVPASPPMTPDRNATDSSSTVSRSSRGLSDPDTETEGHETHLYLPLTLSTDTAFPSANGKEPKLSEADLDAVIGVRNMFAFLLEQSLVATAKRSTVFSIFMKISDWLKTYEFSNLDGSTYGEIAQTSFDNYIEKLGLADVRMSREKTIESIVLGERMRSVSLYNEAFVHGVGKWTEISKMGNPLFELISPITRNRMERASMDLYTREKNIATRLVDFDFPAIFSGIMDSKTADEAKVVRFDAWKASFMHTRKFIMAYYKHKFGSWPPKASKKNGLERDGLNRLVLRTLYQDFSKWYDLAVDRKNLTTRAYGAQPSDVDDDDSDDATLLALRRVLTEYDRSTPPVQPPVPFDVPMLPNLATTRKDYPSGDEKKDKKLCNKKLKDEEVAQILKASHNSDAEIPDPFLDSFREYERKQARRCTIKELCDLRTGQWIFMYAVMQSLPMLVVDAPAIKWTQGVEYFLCEPARSGVPWAREDTATQQRWYEIAGGGGVVSLPADVIEHGVEGVYRRSHCWEMAAKWSEDGDIMAAANQEDPLSPLPPPPGMFLQMPGSRPGSPSRSSMRGSVVNLGLEALPLPQGVSPGGSPSLRPQSSVDTSKTFDAILGSGAATPTKEKKK